MIGATSHPARPHHVLRRCLSGSATDAEHVMVVVDGTGRIPWLDGDPRVRHRADRPTFEEGMHCSKASAETNTISTARAIDHGSKPWRPSSSSPSRTRRGARRRRATTQTAARRPPRSTRAGRDARTPDSLAPAPAAADTPESVRRLERTLSEDLPRRPISHGRPSCSLAAPCPSACRTSVASRRRSATGSS